MTEREKPGPEDAVREAKAADAPGELDRTRVELRSLLSTEKKARFSREFPRSRTMQMLMDKRNRKVLMAVGGGALMLLARRLPAGRVAALLSLYRGARRVIDLSRR